MGLLKAGAVVPGSAMEEQEGSPVPAVLGQQFRTRNELHLWWSQTAAQGGNPSVSFNTSNNQESGFSYDAAGDVTGDGLHSYSYDAEGNVTRVDEGETASYTYDALNRRVRTVVGANAYEFIFNPTATGWRHCTMMLFRCLVKVPLLLTGCEGAGGCIYLQFQHRC